MMKTKSPMRVAIFDQLVSAGGIRRFTLAMLQSWLKLTQPEDYHFILFWPQSDTAGISLDFPFEIDPRHLTVLQLPQLPPGEGIAWLAQHSHQFDLVYFPTTVGLLRSDQDLNLDTPCVVTLHDLAHEQTTAWGNRTPDVRRENRQWAHAADGIIFSSDYIRDESLRLYRMAPEKCHRVYLAPPLVTENSAGNKAQARLRAKYALPNRFLLSPGTAMVHKNPKVIIEAAGLLKQSGIHLPLVFIGPMVTNMIPGAQNPAVSAYHLEMQALIRQFDLQINRDIFILGHVPDDELSVLYHAAAGVVTASFSEAGLSGPVLEGMWYRRPVICSALPQFVERLGADDSLALMFNPNDPHDLAAALARWLKNPAESTQRVDRAAEFIRRRSWDDAAQDYLSVFNRVAEQAAPPARAQTPPAITWGEAIFTFSGYSRLSRQTLAALDRGGVLLAVHPFARHEKFVAQLSADEIDFWNRVCNAKNPDGALIVFHPPVAWDKSDTYAYYRRHYAHLDAFVGVTMFETDRLPPGWAESCNQMDEVWVPSAFNRDTFTRAGVDPAKLHVIPFGFDAANYNPDTVQPLSIPGKRGFTFLSVFQWNRRKGWDVLLQAYLQAFSAADDVCLVIRAYPDRIKEPPLQQRIDDYVRQLGYEPGQIPPIILLDEFVPENEMPALYAAADAFVLPTRGEGWGIPYLEAMAMERPAIATRWSAHLDFMNDDNSYLIDIEGLAPVDADQTLENPFYTPDQQWAEPSVAHTAQLMRHVFDNPAEAKQKARRARQYILAEMNPARTVEWITHRTRQLTARRKTEPAQPAASAPLSRLVGWHGPIFDPSGYADEARNFILQLRQRGVEVAARPLGRHSDTFRAQLPPAKRQALDEALTRQPRGDFINVIHFPAYGYQRLPQAAYNIGRTMFETDRLPPDWVESCNLMDEIWVPTEFNLQTFRQAGVTTKLVKIPGGVDTDRFKPGLPPLSIPGVRGTVFVSMFEWLYRKGWDVLLHAWAQAFSADDDVCLVLRTYPVNAVENANARQTIEARIDEFLRDELGLERGQVAPILVLGEQIPEPDLPRFFAAASAYVSCSRGEGWGRPQMQAMACGLPVIATRWGGNLEFMNDDNSLLLDFERLVDIDERMEFEHFRGHRWAEPSAAHLVQLLRFVVEQPQQAAVIGAQARQDMVEKWQWSHIGNIAIRRLQHIEAELAAPPEPADGPVTELAEPVNVVWEGSQFVTHSLALINREIAIRLAQEPQVNLSLIPYEAHQFGPEADPHYALIAERLNRSLPGPAQIHVRHQWPPNLTPPAEGHWVIIQPWEFGSLPREWVEVFAAQVDELWVPSNFVRNCYIRSGVPAERVFTISNGVSVEKFRPDVPPYPLKTGKRFKFLFVGGTIGRKGIDILLNAYSRAFSANDDVCLVIKDMGGESFYQGQTAQEYIAQLQAAPGAPEVEYINHMLTEEEMAGLYTACDCLVHPYRGEGFGLPIAEAMAAGLPVIVTGYGAALDFCTPQNAYLIPAREVRLPEKQISGRETVEHPWWAEPDQGALQAIMRRVAARPLEAQAKGRRGQADIRAGFTWDHMTAAVKQRLAALVQRPVYREANVPTPEMLALAAGQSALEQGNLERAAAEFEQAAAQFPDFPNAHLLLANTRLALEQWDAAASALQTAANLLPDDSSLRNQLGVLFAQLGRLDDAEAAFAQAHQLAPTDVQILLNQIDLYRAQERYLEATEAVKQALAVDSSNPDVLVAFGALSFELGDTDAAQMALEQLRNAPPNLPGLAELRAALGVPAPANPAELLAQVETAQQAGNWPQAIELLTDLLDSGSPNLPRSTAWLCNSLGVAQVMAGQLAEAESAFQRGLALEPQNIDLLSNLADVYLQQEQFDRGTEYLNRALQADPNDVNVLLALGNVAIQLEQFDAAQAAFERVHQLAPDTPGVDEVLAQLELLLNPVAPQNGGGDAADVQQLMQQVLAPGEAALQRGDLETAVLEFEQVTAQHPDFAAGFTALSSTLLALGRTDEALPALQAAVNLVPDVAALHNQLGILLYRADRPAEAETAFREACRLDSTDVEPLLNLADLFRAQQRYPEARQAVDDALQLNPGFTDALVASGLLHAETGQAAQAQQIWQQLQHSAPGHPGVVALGQLLEQLSPLVNPDAVTAPGHAR